MVEIINRILFLLSELRNLFAFLSRANQRGFTLLRLLNRYQLLLKVALGSRYDLTTRRRLRVYLFIDFLPFVESLSFAHDTEHPQNITK